MSRTSSPSTTFPFGRYVPCHPHGGVHTVFASAARTQFPRASPLFSFSSPLWCGTAVPALLWQVTAPAGSGADSIVLCSLSTRETRWWPLRPPLPRLPLAFSRAICGTHALHSRTVPVLLPRLGDQAYRDDQQPGGCCLKGVSFCSLAEERPHGRGPRSGRPAAYEGAIARV